jgi:hypothetical protein
MQGDRPYRKQVTRGQDLTGKDLSGQTLIKQDFKVVHTYSILAFSFHRLLHFDLMI